MPFHASQNYTYSNISNSNLKIKTIEIFFCVPKKKRQIRFSAPGHRERTLANITLAAFHGSSYLVAVNAGAVKADKSRLNGVRLALDAAGLVGAARERLNAALASGQVARVLALSDEERARVRALLGLGDGVDVIDVPADAERDIDPDS